jgi:hypothetical protein
VIIVSREGMRIILFQELKILECKSLKQQNQKSVLECAILQIIGKPIYSCARTTTLLTRGTINLDKTLRSPKKGEH